MTKSRNSKEGTSPSETAFNSPMLTFTPQACEAICSIWGRQSMIRGTIKTCKAMVASNKTAQKLIASHHTT